MVEAKRADPKALASVGITKLAVGDDGCSGAVMSFASIALDEVLGDGVALGLAALACFGLALGFAVALVAVAVFASSFMATGVSLDSVILFLGQSGEAINGFFARGHKAVRDGLNGGCHRGAGLTPGIHGSHFCG